MTFYFVIKKTYKEKMQGNTLVTQALGPNHWGSLDVALQFLTYELAEREVEVQLRLEKEITAYFSIHKYYVG